MAAKDSSNLFTESPADEPPVGPPLIGALLRFPWEVVRRRMLERLHECGFDDLELPHLTVLQYPGPDGARPSELAARLGMSKQALNYLLGELERVGYLERRPDPGDGRSKRIALTRRGASVVPVLRAAVIEVEQEWAHELGSRRFAQLRTLLVDLNKVI
jgi:DNA-binding MarR family transcriptional regulator